MFRLIFKLIGFVCKAAWTLVKIVLILGLVCTIAMPIVSNLSSKETAHSDQYLVVRVVDGDTFIAEKDGYEIKVRMIGIDTPESVHADESKNTAEGKQASEFTSELLTGRYITLELDVAETDAYGRTLAYVYLDGVMVQDTLLSSGYARVMTVAPNVKYADHFVEIEQEAQRQGSGFWATDVWE